MKLHQQTQNSKENAILVESMGINKANVSKEEKGNKKFMCKCNHCSKVGHTAANCWELEANKDKKHKS